MRQVLSKTFISLMAWFIMAGVLYAQSNSLCSAVLKDNVFNIGSTSSVEIIAYKMRDDLCSVHWENKQDFLKASSDSGIDVGYAGFTVGLEESDFKDAAILHKKYDLFCHKSAADIASNVNFYNKYRNSDMAVGAWEKCVQQTADGHFALVRPDAGLEGATIRLSVRQPNIPRLKIRAITPAGAYEVKCNYGSTTATDAVFPDGATEVAISCVKRADQPVTFMIDTNWGTFEPIQLPGFSKTISDLQSDIALTRKLLQSETEQLNKRIDAVNASALKSCRVCFHADGPSDQCHGSRDTCSGWSGVTLNASGEGPAWTAVFEDDTDNRDGLCSYKWRVECGATEH